MPIAIKRAILKPTKRGKSVIAAAVALSASVGGYHYSTSTPKDLAHMPVPVIIAVELRKQWEGFAPRVYDDKLPKRVTPTYCYGETLNPDRNRTYTEKECSELLAIRVYRDYYLPLTKSIKGFASAPDSLQGAATSLAYNVGTGAVIGSSIDREIQKKDYDNACKMFPKFDRAGGREWQGLYNSRAMGDASRVGEAEVCLSKGTQ